MKKPHFLLALSLLSMVLFLPSCKDKTPAPTPIAAYGTGIFVVNEGPFQNGTGTITYINRSTSAVQQDVFGQANNRPLGNVAQSMASRGLDKLAFIVVNNANKIELVDLNEFKSVGTINGLSMPSKMVVPGSNGKAYVTEWVGFGVPGRVAVIDIASRSILRTIPVGEFPNAIHLHNNRIYVANGNENTVSEISLSADTVIRTIQVGDRPNSFLSEGDVLWVLCGGNPSWTGNETAGSLVSILGPVIRHYPLLAVTDHPSNLTRLSSNGLLLCTVREGVYGLGLGNTSASVNGPLINRSFYHLALDPFPGGYLYGTDAGDFTSNGWVYRFQRNYTLVDSLPAGIGPGFIHFK